MTPREWLKSRKLSAETIQAFGIKCSDREVKFPYRKSAKYRRHPRPDVGEAWRSDGGTLELFNLDAVLAGKKPHLFLTEGEFDALALHSAGVPQDQILSLPNGAQSLAAVERAREEGLQFKSITILHDADDAGFACREQLVELIGPAYCKFVEWPEGVKDANDFLVAESPADLADFLRQAKPWPMPGLVRMSQVPEAPKIEIWELGYPEIAGKIKTARGLLLVSTGHPGHGKSHFAFQTTAQIAELYDFPFAFLSMETHTKPYVRRIFRQTLMGCREDAATGQQLARADAWIEEHALAMTPPKTPTLEWVLEHAEAAVVRHGAKAVVIDPWNKLEHARPRDVSETDYIGRCLDQCMQFAKSYHCQVHIIAHPAKVMGKTKSTPPDLENISGSKNWDNRIDQGWVIFREKFTDDFGNKVGDCNLMQQKARYQPELGYNAIVDFRLDETQGRFICTEAETHFEREMNSGKHQ